MNADLIDLGLGTIQLKLDAADVFTTLASHSYSPPGGIPALREAIGLVEGVDPEEIVVTTGASMGIVATLAQLKKPGKVLIPTPYYPSYPSMVRLVGLEPTLYAVDADERASQPYLNNIDRLVALIDDDTRAILVNTPGNPLGNLFSATEMAAITEAARQHNFVVVVDEVYGGIVYEPASSDWCGCAIEPNMVRIKSFSKTYRLPGERVGYVVAPRDLAGRIERAHWAMTMSASNPGQITAARALVRGGPDSIRELISSLRQSRDILFSVVARCRHISTDTPRAGIFAWLEFPDSDLDGRTIAHLCHERAGVQVMAGEHFGVESPPSIRCSFALSADRVREAAHRLRSVFDAVACSVSHSHR